jgi:hypothetical protein
MAEINYIMGICPECKTTSLPGDLKCLRCGRQFYYTFKYNWYWTDSLFFFIIIITFIAGWVWLYLTLHSSIRG